MDRKKVSGISGEKAKELMKKEVLCLVWGLLFFQI